VPDENEIDDDVLNECAECEDSGRSKYPGMSYEQGVTAAIRWMQGDGSNPMTE
jgi:hypothetical protein